uniref:Uncharacterized protein n=2 Tax=Physcomitrium patens TaxID=3218 RepID=A0A2K1INL7_PHYPA|nr:hypothetical protein PHYPA_027189 [Physcomitrium patens]
MATSFANLHLRHPTVFPLSQSSTLTSGWSPTQLIFLTVGRRQLALKSVQAKSKQAGSVSRSGTQLEGSELDGILGAVSAKKRRSQWCLCRGIESGSRELRYLSWGSGGRPQDVMLEPPVVEFDVDILRGVPLSLRAAVTEGAISSSLAICWRWMLSVAVAISINFIPWSSSIALAQTEVVASGCDNVTQYYSQASGLQGEKLKAKLHEIVAGHKRLTYAQVWNALKILDAADTATPETSPDVVDIYSLKRVSKSLQGSSDGWNREHLWPRSYGLTENQSEFTDVHNLRPADVNVNSSRGNKYFGDCTTLQTTRCLIPANREAAPDTATDSNSWRPPSEVRGDIARAVFYMAVRYGLEQPSGSLNLQLSDSPSVANATMGLLSTLLEWNNLDPPSPSEVLRNSRVCSLYQGNRNPFVDHPEYASSIWDARTVATGPNTPGEPTVSSGSKNENPLPNAWINEIHYNNKGQDQDEFIEVIVGPNTEISSLKIYLYSSDGKVYRNLPLADAALFQASNVNGSSSLIYSTARPGRSIQNGPADGIALVQERSENKSKVIQFLSYEGVLTAAEGPAKGSTSKDIGVHESERSEVGSSLGLSGFGRRYEDFKWTKFSKAATPGSLNSGQLFS